MRGARFRSDRRWDRQDLRLEISAKVGLALFSRRHFTPTYRSWINQMGRWFGLLTARQIERGAHRSVHELETAIKQFLKAHNRDSEPFVWAKSADDILASIERFARRAAEVHAVLNTRT